MDYETKEILKKIQKNTGVLRFWNFIFIAFVIIYILIQFSDY